MPCAPRKAPSPRAAVNVSPVAGKVEQLVGHHTTVFPLWDGARRYVERVRPRLISILAVASIALLGGCAPQFPVAVPAGDAVPLFVQDKRDDKRDNLSDAALDRL